MELKNTEIIIKSLVTISVKMWICALAVKAVVFLQGRLWLRLLFKAFLIEVDKRILFLLQDLLAASKTRGVGHSFYPKACLA